MTFKKLVVKNIKKLPEAEAQAHYKRAARTRWTEKVLRQITENFSDKDVWITLAYEKSKLPENLAQAETDVDMYMKRLQSHAAHMRWDELKYMYVTEYVENEGEDKKVHHHIICNFPGRLVAELFWSEGRTHSRYLKTDASDLEMLARYITTSNSFKTTSVNLTK